LIWLMFVSVVLTSSLLFFTAAWVDVTVPNAKVKMVAMVKICAFMMLINLIVNYLCFRF
jgi:hypothetical protein